MLTHPETEAIYAGATLYQHGEFGLAADYYREAATHATSIDNAGRWGAYASACERLAQIHQQYGEGTL